MSSHPRGPRFTATSATVAAAAKAQTPAEARQLNLSGRNLDDAELQQVCALAPALEGLDISQNPDVTDLKRLAPLTRLRELTLDGCTGVSVLRGALALPALRRLSLRDCAGVADLRELGGLEGAPGLTHLWLSGAAVTRHPAFGCHAVMAHAPAMFELDGQRLAPADSAEERALLVGEERATRAQPRQAQLPPSRPWLPDAAAPPPAAAATEAEQAFAGEVLRSAQLSAEAASLLGRASLASATLSVKAAGKKKAKKKPA